LKIKTHYLIGKMAVNEDLALSSFQKLLFHIGTILPDLSFSQFIHPHFYKNSSKYIFKKLEKLTNSSLPYIMLEYGKIAHYCSDFCCSVHFNGITGNVYEHIKYEKELAKYIEENYSQLLNEANKFITKNIKLQDIFCEYNKSIKYDLNTDLISSVKVCRIICRLMSEHIKRLNRESLINTLEVTD